VRKSDLFELISAIKNLSPDEIPIIVGSQSVHIITNFPPEIVRQSIECDFLIVGGKSGTRVEINKKLGVFSQFQIEHGFYADALGLATVILPIGWQERLQNLEDENGKVIANVAEIHDIAVSKLIAGREKDFVFLKELFLLEYISIETFIERAALINEMPQSEVLVSRLENLARVLPKIESLAVKNFVAKLKSK
jgi:hypothetical protein